MAEALGIAGSAVGIVSLGIQIAEGLLKYYESWKDQDEDVSNMCASLENLLRPLSLLSNTIQPPAEFDKSVKDNVERNIDLVQAAITELNDELETVKTTTSLPKGLRSRMRRHVRRTLYPFKVQTLRKIQQSVSDARSNLDIALQVLHLDGTQDLRREVSLLVRWKKDKETRNILHWLSPVNFWLKQADVQSQREPGTGQWLLEHADFLDWADGKKDTVWCLGSPGVGKTVLSAAVIGFLEKDLPSQDTGLAFVYCDHKQKLLQRIEYFIGAIVRQLVEQRKSVPDAVSTLYKQHEGKGTIPTRTEYLDLLQTLSKDCAEVYIVVDALDECIDKRGDLKWRELLANLEKHITNLHLLYTSRHIDDMERISAGTTCIEIRASDSDMSVYIQTQVNTKTSLLNFCQKDSALQNDILQRVLSRAEGMFLAARLYIEALSSKRSLRAVKKALNEMPEKLDDIYDQTMERICGSSDGSIALRALTWIIFAVRPLKVKELQHAIAINELEPGDTSISDDMLTPEGWIVDACAGLIKIDEESDIIGLVHKTTQDYFDRTGPIHFPHGPKGLGLECLTYLSLDVFSEGSSTTNEFFEQRLIENALLNYAAHSFGKYFPETMDSCLQEALMGFLSNKRKVESAIQALFNMRLSPLLIGDYSQIFPSNFSGLHYAAYMGWVNVINYLIIDPEAQLDREDGYHRTALSWAAENGHENAVKLLIDTGKVDPDLEDEFGEAPLAKAARYGHKAVAKLLLDTGKVDIHLKNKNGETPFLTAIEFRREAVVSLLLDTGNIDPESMDEIRGLSALSVAAKIGDKAIVQLLLDTKRVCLESRDNKLQTPLFHAVRGKDEGVVKLLLDTDKVDVNAKNDSGQTPLHRAARKGLESIVKQLLDTGKVDIEPKNERGETPLLLAAMCGHVSVVRLLLDTGKVNVNTMDIWFGRTPLSWAAVNDHLAIVKLLLDTGEAGINTTDNFGRTPLLLAISHDHLAVVRCLLENVKLDVNLKDNGGRAPLVIAMKRMNTTVVQLLLDTEKVDVNIMDDYNDETPLLSAAYHGNKVGVKQLLERGADVSFADKEGRTPLAWASRRGNEDIVKLLLETNGTDADPVDNFGQTPLLFAAEEGHKDVAALLIATGRVNINASDTEYGRTAISWAAGNGHASVVRLLEASGADASLVDKLGRTPLSWAAEKGHKEVFQQLLGIAQIQVDLKDSYACTPLLWAAGNRNKAVVKLLLETKKVDINSKDKNGKTSLIWAARDGTYSLVKMLLEVDGVEVNAQDKYGRTALSYAAERGEDEIVRLLLDISKIEVNLEDNAAQTPLFLATRNGHEDIMNMLLQVSSSVVD